MSLRNLRLDKGICAMCHAWSGKNDFGPPTCSKCGEVDLNLFELRVKFVQADENGKLIEDPDQKEWRVVDSKLKKILNKLDKKRI